MSYIDIQIRESSAPLRSCEAALTCEIIPIETLLCVLVSNYYDGVDCKVEAFLPVYNNDASIEPHEQLPQYRVEHLAHG